MDQHHAIDISTDRRRILKGLGAALAMVGLGRLSGPILIAQEACTTLTNPSLTEGPYFVEEILNRSDIRTDPTDQTIQAGLPITLLVNVYQRNSDCTVAPLTGGYVDIWHCNASGIYSDVEAQDTSGKKFLRGYQAIDREGNAAFTTIYPGWYSGRSVHIHAKVRTFSGNDQQYEFTTQFFFDDAVTDQVYTLEPYSDRPGRDTLNANDGIYLGASSLGDYASNSGDALLLQITQNAKTRGQDGKSSFGGKSHSPHPRSPSATALLAYIPLIVDLSLGSSPDQTQSEGGGPGGGPGGGLPGMPPGGF